MAVQFRGAKEKGPIVHHCIKHRREEKFNAEMGGRAGLAHEGGRC